MPGICGVVTFDGRQDTQRIVDDMLTSLSYGRCMAIEKKSLPNLAVGGAHLAVLNTHIGYESERALVFAHGYVVPPRVKPRLDGKPVDDAQYVHDLYLKLGESFVDKLNGIFAIAIWDRQEQKLLLINDHLGLYPLYYTSINDTLLFASEVKALLVHPQVKQEIDERAVACFFSFAHLLDDHTFLRHIRLLPPATLLTWRRGQTRTSHYWELTFANEPERHDAQWYDEQIYETIRQTVQDFIVPGLRYGLMLSGGMDSRWLAATLSATCPGLITFTFGDQDADDVRLARRVANSLGLEHRWEPLPPNFIADLGKEISWASDGMYSLVHAHEFPIVRDRVADEVDVVMGGFFGDVLFGGEVNIVALTRRHDNLFRWIYARHRRNTAPDAVLQTLFGNSYNSYRDMARESLLNTLPAAPMHPVHTLNYQNYTQRQRRFTYFAQTLKRPYVEAVHPLCDKRLIELAVHMPIGYLHLERAYRHALAHHFPALARIEWPRTALPISASIVAIYLQQALIRTLGKAMRKSNLKHRWPIRVKRPTARYAEWMRGPLQPFIQDILLGGHANRFGLFDGDGVRRLVDAHVKGRSDLSDLLGLLLAFELWSQSTAAAPRPRPTNTDGGTTNLHRSE